MLRMNKYHDATSRGPVAKYGPAFLILPGMMSLLRKTRTLIHFCWNVIKNHSINISICHSVRRKCERFCCSRDIFQSIVF